MKDTIHFEDNSRQDNGNSANQVYTKKDLLTMLPFGKTKLNDLLQAGILPVVKIGRHYLTNESMINRWIEENVGKELYY